MVDVREPPDPGGYFTLTEDDLPCNDGIPMDTHLNVVQMTLLIDPLVLYWGDRKDRFVSGNMFVYFSPDQARDEDFRGPDVFVALDVVHRPRKSWVVWQQGKPPDVVIDLLSETTEVTDRTIKKEIYQDRLKAPEYFWHDVEIGESAGFSLQNGVYVPILPGQNGMLISHRLNLALVGWYGTYKNDTSHWLRWATTDGVLLPTPFESAKQAEERLHEEFQHIYQVEERLREEQQRARQTEQKLREERHRADLLAAKLR